MAVGWVGGGAGGSFCSAIRITDGQMCDERMHGACMLLSYYDVRQKHFPLIDYSCACTNLPYAL